MEKITSEVIKGISKTDISIKKNYKLFRILQKIINPSFINKKDYEDIIFDLEDRKIKTRVFKSCTGKENSKLIIFIHGGGWVTGSVDSYTNTCIELSHRTNRMVVAIDYRLAPEYPYPAGFNDCYEVTKLIMKNLGSLNLSYKDVCLMGDSAGANLVAAISLKARDTKDFKIENQILLYPALQTDYSNKTKYKSVIENGKDYLLTQKQLQEYMNLYVTNPKDLNNPYVAPLKARTLFFQPRTLLITSNHDPLRDEGKKYARRLKLYFNYVVYYNFEDAIHGFLSQPIGKKHKMEAYKRIIQFLGDDKDE